MSTSPVARGKTLKLYQNLLDVVTRVNKGDELFYQDGVNLFKNKYNLEQAFVYEQEIKGEYDWEKDKILVVDFTNYATPRTIKIDVTKRKTLESLES
ncbi:hypothetical protein KO02_06615 [Sphingobacterium sp. ML3W]|uniref:hypothetical protein n=1 Tax=Sphingobacterium sp. ML3W TaxID=1538644 RepID=UPI0004F5EB99|nr:hypothetical protein [Sphingobacterium sp. ML3W]AIM36408.1 hypothetical protein KO02_06615 [Sphingobacterium sp. ML3W]